MLKTVETSDKNRIAVQDVGDGDPVVMLAGFGMDHTVWDGQVAVLSATHRTLCIDLRGTGQSDKPREGYTLSELTNDVIAVTDALGVEAFDLVGWSFGGQISFNLAARHPERVHRLVLVGSNGVRACRSDDFPFGHRRDQLESLLVRGEQENRLTARRATITSGFATPPEPAVMDYLTSVSLQMPSWAALACYSTMFDADLVSDLPSLKMPVRMIVGSADPVHPVQGARWLTERLFDGDLLELPGCGHYPMFEAGPELDRGLRRFLGDDPNLPGDHAEARTE
ncbi:alpha/beta fold hydrolase [Rhodococcus pyridinivorans]|uniref:alpha/beta fold hydrolase n=1 Tax=Rhodococcus pyridinivorans TaxID=103816 RepID=UPI0019310531|nr:alpha/beta hydrolase [Rhodococcus pyridinivorans]